MNYVILKDEKNYLVQAKNSLKEHGFCVIKNFFPYEPLAKILENFRENFSAENDIRRTGPYKYKMPNFQRLDLGDFSQVNARFSRMWTNFSWNSGGEFEEPIKRMINFRIIRKILSLKNPVTYISDTNMVYIYGEGIIFGLDLNVVKLFEDKYEKILNKVKNLENNTLVDLEIFNKCKDLILKLKNKNKYIPYIYEYGHK